jgi:hypothetical protein
MPPSRLPQAAWMSKAWSSSPRALLEVARLDAVRRGARVAVHGIAAPKHGLAGRSHRFDQRRQEAADALSAEAVNQRKTARFVVRVEDLHDLLQRVRLHGRPHLHADGTLEAPERS